MRNEYKDIDIWILAFFGKHAVFGVVRHSNYLDMTFCENL